MSTHFSATTIWIVTAIFNFLGAVFIPSVRTVQHGPIIQDILFYFRFWPAIAVCLAILAIIKLRQRPNQAIEPRR